jgi:hypothetical protein
MLPDGQVYHNDRLELDDLDPDTLAIFRPQCDGLRYDSVIDSESGRLRIQWTGYPGGIAIGSFHLDDQMFLCTALAGGLDSQEDQTVLTTTCGAWARSDMVRGLSEGRPSPFERVHEIPDRPLLVGLLIPMLDPATYGAIAGADVIATRLFLDRVTEA